MPEKAGAVTVTNSIQDNSFNPRTNIINVGDTVKWINQGFEIHTTTRTANPNTWDSGDLNPGQSYSMNFSQAGSFSYLCVHHSGQTGRIIVQAVNVAPSVSITNPANGTVFASGATIQIGASASDSDGSVTNVAFLVGANLISNDTTSPYSATTNLSVGNYTLFAVATDNAGAKATNSISISVSAPPTVVFPNGTVFNVDEGSPLNFNVSASDSDGPSLTLSATNLPSGAIFVGTSVPFTFYWTPNYGSSYNSPYTVTFTASDGVNPVVNSNATINVNFVSTPINISGQTLSNNQFQFHASGLRVTRTNFVQASTNLPDWFSIQTNVSTNVSFDFTDPNPAGAKFYRVLESR